MSNENYYDTDNSIALTVDKDADKEYDSVVTIGEPVVKVRDDIPACNISVFAQPPKLNSYQSTANISTFDIVFDVTIKSEDNSYETYQVVRRIGVDKCKLAREAKKCEPVCIVESKSTKKENTISTVNQMRKLAGLV